MANYKMAATLLVVLCTVYVAQASVPAHLRSERAADELATSARSRPRRMLEADRAQTIDDVSLSARTSGHQRSRRLLQSSGCGDAGWTPLWRDEFDGDQLNDANWDVMQYDGWQYKVPDWGNNEAEWYTNRTQNVRVENGSLVLQAQLESGEGLNWLLENCWDECRARCAAEGYPGQDACIHPCAWPRCDYVKGRSITSARIRTMGKVAVAPAAQFPTVRVEARMELPSGTGLWPAFWLLPEGNNAAGDCTGCGAYGGWPLSGEIDVMEAVNNMDTLLGSIHYGGAGDQHAFSTGKTPLTPGPHTFALEWEADAMRWYLDGVQYHSAERRSEAAPGGWFTAAPAASASAPFDAPFHLLLNLAVGGTITGVDLQAAKDTLAAGPAQLRVEFVRVCAKVAGANA